VEYVYCILGGRGRRFLAVVPLSVSCVNSFAIRMSYEVYSGHAVA
jgi:hypothetical protein